MKLETVPHHAEMVELVPWVNVCVQMASKETTVKIQVRIIVYLMILMETIKLYSPYFSVEKKIYAPKKCFPGPRSKKFRGTITLLHV